VVQAGVPKRIPDVIHGFCSSKGIPFLLQVKFAFPKEISASFPVNPSGLRSIRTKCVSVPPEKIWKRFFKTNSFSSYHMH
jgi:hypothetical protein